MRAGVLVTNDNAPNTLSRKTAANVYKLACFSIKLIALDEYESPTALILRIQRKNGMRCGSASSERVQDNGIALRRKTQKVFQQSERFDAVKVVLRADDLVQ